MKRSHSVSGMEALYTIFINNIEPDENGAARNAKYAERRAARYIKEWCVEGCRVGPTSVGSEEVGSC